MGSGGDRDSAGLFTDGVIQGLTFKRTYVHDK